MNYILWINATLDQLIFNGRAKTKLAMLAFLYCGEIIKKLYYKRIRLIRFLVLTVPFGLLYIFAKAQTSRELL